MEEWSLASQTEFSRNGMKKRYWKLPLKRETRTLSPSPKKNEWVKKVGKEGSLRMDGLRLKKKMTNHKKHNNITHTKRWGGDGELYLYCTRLIGKAWACEYDRSEWSVQRSVKTFLPGFGHGWLKLCARHSAFFVRAAKHFKADSRNLKRMFLHNYHILRE